MNSESRDEQSLIGEVVRILGRVIPGIPVAMFGSRANGNAKEYSDIDLMLLTDAPVSLALLGNVREAFAESDLPVRVDIVDGAATSADFKQIALKGSRRLT